MCKEESEIFIVGGAEIYTLFLKVAKKLLLTKIDLISECDAHFPALTADWKQVGSVHSTSKTGLNFEFCEFSKTV
jgi:dihydrofolate reductase